MAINEELEGGRRRKNERERERACIYCDMYKEGGQISINFSSDFASIIY